jgi:hypothetical protein
MHEFMTSTSRFLTDLEGIVIPFFVVASTVVSGYQFIRFKLHPKRKKSR